MTSGEAVKRRGYRLLKRLSSATGSRFSVQDHHGAAGMQEGIAQAMKVNCTGEVIF